MAHRKESPPLTDEQDIVREFLIESNENLGHLDNELVDLEQRPKDSKLLVSIFRTVHTIPSERKIGQRVQPHSAQVNLDRVGHLRS